MKEWTWVPKIAQRLQRARVTKASQERVQKNSKKKRVKSSSKNYTGLEEGRILIHIPWFTGNKGQFLTKPGWGKWDKNFICLPDGHINIKLLFRKFYCFLIKEIFSCFKILIPYLSRRVWRKGKWEWRDKTLMFSLMYWENIYICPQNIKSEPAT